MDAMLKIHERMPVVSSDGRLVGFVTRFNGTDRLRVTRVKDGQGFEHVIPLAWVSDVDDYVFLNCGSAFVAANWETATPGIHGTRAA